MQLREQKIQILDNSQIQKIKQKKKGVIFSAQKVSIDNELQTLIATGNVKLELDNIKLSSRGNNIL